MSIWRKVFDPAYVPDWWFHLSSALCGLFGAAALCLFLLWIVS